MHIYIYIYTYVYGQHPPPTKIHIERSCINFQYVQAHYTVIPKSRKQCKLHTYIYIWTVRRPLISHKLHLGLIQAGNVKG